MVDGTSAWIEAVRLAAAGQGPALALARPPGHHATRTDAMGFCLVNFAAAAAAAHLDATPAARVSVLDWDVHHGNGVADILGAEPRARYSSTHETGGFPYTGLDEDDRGPHANLLHLPLPAGSGGEEYLQALRTRALPFLLPTDEPLPDVLLVCAGYDGLESDALAGTTCSPDDFAESIRAIVDEFGFPPERIALGLEGGYQLEDAAGMPAALAATCAALLEAEGLAAPIASSSPFSEE